MNKRPTTLVFVPGSLCDARLFRPQLDYFSGQYNVVVANVAHHNSMQDMAESVLHNSPEQFVLIGLSMGGIIAMEIMRQAPERVSALILMDTNPGGELPERVAMRDQHIQVVQEGGENAMLSIVNEQLYPKYLPPGRNDTTIEATVMSMAKSAGPQAFINQWQALRDRPDSTQSIEEIRCPTLIVCGKEDQLCPQQKHEFLHQCIANSRLEVMPDCGHLSTLEMPDRVNSSIEQFLGDA